MVRLVTGGTGFIGRQLLRELAKRDGTTYVLVRQGSRERLEHIIDALGANDRMHPLVGDITLPVLGISQSDQENLSGADVYHLAAVYDLEASEEANERANVVGTQNAVDLASRVGARFHHVSSIAVAGAKWKGKFTEAMFDEGQPLDHPYYRTKYEAERIVRASGLRFRIYRPGLVIGSSQTGAADRIDGPYYAFKIIQRLRNAIPPWVPLIGLEGGEINIVPVDFVARALDAIGHKEGLDGETFHLTDPAARSLGDVTNEFCRAAHAPQFTLRVDSRASSMFPKEMTAMLQHWRVAQTLKRRLLEGVRIPEPALHYITNRARFTSERAQAALDGTGVECPPLHSYAWKIWDHWERHLDPEALNERNLRVVLHDRVVVVTGASSGIGRATAQLMGRHGAKVALVSRTKEKLDTLHDEIQASGGRAFVYPTDLSDLDQCEAMIHHVLADHGRVDILINNAGRSDPAVGGGVIRSLPRLPAHYAAQLLRRRQADARGAAWDAQPPPRPHHQHLEHRHAGVPTPIRRVRRLEVRAGRAEPLHRPRGRGRRRRDHQHPHAVGADTHDRADRDLQELPNQLARRGG